MSKSARDALPTMEAFVTSHRVHLLRLAYLVTGNQQDAEDLAHDALIRIGERWPLVSCANSPTAYAKRILVNTYLTQTRAHRIKVVPLNENEGGAARADFTLAVVDRLTVEAALRRLPARQKAAIILKYYEHLTTSEVGDIMGLTESSVRSAVSRGLDALRNLTQSECDL